MLGIAGGWGWGGCRGGLQGIKALAARGAAASEYLDLHFQPQATGVALATAKSVCSRYQLKQSVGVWCRWCSPGGGRFVVLLLAQSRQALGAEKSRVGRELTSPAGPAGGLSPFTPTV